LQENGILSSIYLSNELSQHTTVSPIMPLTLPKIEEEKYIGNSEETVESIVFRPLLFDNESPMTHD
jgi:hypothetical protein